MAADAEALRIFFVVLGILGIISLGTIVISVIGLWGMFKKAGEEGWKSIIPVYNLYTLMEIVGMSPVWLIVLIAVVVLSPIVQSLSAIFYLIVLYFSVILCGSIAKSFGKSEAFGFGLYFLSPIFYLILGVGSSKYLGKMPMKDPIMEFVDENILHKETTTKQSETTSKSTTSKTEKKSFCTNCGTKLDDDSQFCTSCGTKVD